MHQTQNVCSDFLYNIYLKHFSFYEAFNDMLSQIYIGLYVKYSLFLSDFNQTSVFSTDFFKNAQIINFIKISPVTAEMFHAGR
jgi:hypothetical protein